MKKLVKESLKDVLKPKSQEEIESGIEDIKKTKKGKALLDMKDSLDNIGINSIFVGNLLKLPDIEFELEYHDLVDLWTAYNKNNMPLYDGRKRLMIKYLRRKHRRINEAIGDIFSPKSEDEVKYALRNRLEYKRFIQFLEGAEVLDNYNNISISNEDYWGGKPQMQYKVPAQFLDIIIKQKKQVRTYFTVYLKQNTGKYTYYYSHPIFEERIMASPKRLKNLVFVWEDVDEQLKELKEIGEFNKEELGNLVDYIRKNHVITSAPYYRDAIDKKILIDNLIRGSKIKTKSQ